MYSNFYRFNGLINIRKIKSRIEINLRGKNEGAEYDKLFGVNDSLFMY